MFLKTTFSFLVFEQKKTKSKNIRKMCLNGQIVYKEEVDYNISG